MPRNGPTETYTLDFDDGQLTEVRLPVSLPIETISESKFDKYLATLQPGTHLVWSKKLGIERNAWYRALPGAAARDLIFQQGGHYYKSL